VVQANNSSVVQANNRFVVQANNRFVVQMRGASDQCFGVRAQALGTQASCVRGTKHARLEWFTQFAGDHDEPAQRSRGIVTHETALTRNEAPCSIIVCVSIIATSLSC
jgi:hypothetical protein